MRGSSCTRATSPRRATCRARPSGPTRASTPSPGRRPSGADFVIRPIRPEDETLVVDFHGRLSDETVYQRYFTKLGYEQRVAHERMVRVCFTDYDREIALVAEQVEPSDRQGCASPGWRAWCGVYNSGDAEISLVVCDECQGQGLGTELVRRLVEVGREEGVERLVAETLTHQRGHDPHRHRAGLQHRSEDGGETLRAELRLQG